MRKKKNALIFMSGTGSNAEKLLDYSRYNVEANFNVLALVTDRLDKSNTKVIAKEYNLEYIALDIFDFYKSHGEDSIALTTPRRWEIRELWTAKLSQMIKGKHYDIDFILLAGFEPLTNITNEYVTLNVHPGDLIYEVNGERVLNGLSIKPIEYAIYLGLDYLRSSVIIAQNFTGKSTDIDSGPILGISEKMLIDFCGFKPSELQELYRQRPSKLPKGFSDALREVARINLAKLKIAGDHIVFPRVVNDFANDKFKIASNDLYYQSDNGDFEKIKTIEYSKEHRARIY